MQVYSDAPSGRRLHHKLRSARHRAQALGRRTSCDCCGARRGCARVDELGEGPWYCLAECWPYFRGLADGESAAAATVRDLVTRELDRVFDPQLVELRGWPRYRCDVCGHTTARGVLAEQLAAQGWRALGRDAHLCPACAPEICAESGPPGNRHLRPSGGPVRIAPRSERPSLPPRSAYAS